jgi:hypothetical protein
MRSKSGQGVRIGFGYSRILEKRSEQYRSFLSPPEDPSITNIPRGNSDFIVQRPRIGDILEEAKVNFEYDIESLLIPALLGRCSLPARGPANPIF